eukprot:461358_1
MVFVLCLIFSTSLCINDAVIDNHKILELPEEVVYRTLTYLNGIDIASAKILHAKWKSASDEIFGINKIEKIKSLINEMNDESYSNYLLPINNIVNASVISPNAMDQLLCSIISNNNLTKQHTIKNVLHAMRTYSGLWLGIDHIEPVIIYLKDPMIDKTSKCELLVNESVTLDMKYFKRVDHIVLDWIKTNCNYSSFETLWIEADTELLKQLINLKLPLGSTYKQKFKVTQHLLQLVLHTDLYDEIVMEKLIIDYVLTIFKLNENE